MPDLFITNMPEHSLKRRLRVLIERSEELKFLVGFFYFSGWGALVDAIRTQPEVRIKILVGLEVDTHLGESIEIAAHDPHASEEERVQTFFASLKKALNNEALDTRAFYDQVSLFLDMLTDGRLEIRRTQEPNHAKLYIFKLKDPGIQPARFITGSSNLTSAGLETQAEFNVELGDYGAPEAEAWFDDLWSKAVPVTADDARRDQLRRIVQDQTQAAAVSPFEAYLLVLHTYMELMTEKIVRPQVERIMTEANFKPYTYQVEAVQQALNIIDAYNGVILADVVGLGKTVIACTLGRMLQKRGMVICPPGLIGDEHGTFGWKKYLRDFHLSHWEVWSLGSLEKALEYVQSPDGADIEVIVIDEAHRFRNEDTEAYELLSAVCRGRKVILLTATPINNSPADVFAMLKLFLTPGRSPITLDPNLEKQFDHFNTVFRQLSFITRYHGSAGVKGEKAEKDYKHLFGDLPIDMSKVQAAAHELTVKIRAVLEPITIRRNRLDLKTDPHFHDEELQMPLLHEPVELFYELSPEQETFYDHVIHDYFGEGGRFKGAIYQPFRYEQRDPSADRLTEEENRALQQQTNLFDFMRRLVVKRFESSFGAFCQTIGNFARVHRLVLAFIEASSGRFILDRRLMEQSYEDDPDEIDQVLEEFAQRLNDKTDRPKHDKVYVIEKFDLKDEFIEDIRSDLAMLEELLKQVQQLKLVEDDPKARRLVIALKDLLRKSPPPGEPLPKVIIFSEYLDTVKHLNAILEREFPGKVLTVAGDLSTKAKLVFRGFDASCRLADQEDSFRILLTSDKLSEGINLNRANSVINYDIPWNPVRVIQRVGRINRIGRGKPPHSVLYLYNFFPTSQGAEVVKSREIAAQKMFLIHQTLGEDAKIFAVDEEPSPAVLYQRLNASPDEDEEESLTTRIRREYYELCARYPEIAERVRHLPARVKTAKAFPMAELFVFRRKGLGLFVQSAHPTEDGKIKVDSALLDMSLAKITCPVDEPRLPLSDWFWKGYDAVKAHRDAAPAPDGPASLVAKSINNLMTAMQWYRSDLADELPFIKTLIEDLREYRTLPMFTMRRLTNVELKPDHPELLLPFRIKLSEVRNYLGDDYLDIVKARAAVMRTEVIIAIELQPPAS